MEQKQRIAVFAGSFNPFTIGHADVVDRALPLFDKIIICIGCNAGKGAEDAQANAAAIRALYAQNPRIEVTVWDGLTADFAKAHGAAFLLRSVRSVKDYEYERDMADANRKVFGIDTLLLMADPAMSYVSSSLVRELQKYGCDVSQFLPKP